MPATAVAGVRKLSVGALVAKALFVETRMTGNPHFANPIPTIAAITTARTELEAAHVVAMDGGRTAHLDQRRKATVLSLLLTELAGYVTSMSGGDELVIISSGFAVRKLPAPIGPLDAPGNLRASLTPYPGQALLRWEPVYGGYTYAVYRKPEGAPDTDYVLVATVTRSTFLDEGLTTGSFYWYRVVANGAAGPSPPSDPARTLVA